VSAAAHTLEDCLSFCAIPTRTLFPTLNRPPLLPLPYYYTVTVLLQGWILSKELYEVIQHWISALLIKMKLRGDRPKFTPSSVLKFGKLELPLIPHSQPIGSPET
jgi:hypothetical protein